MISKGERVLIVAAHPDDEILGCGGTIFAATKKFPRFDAKSEKDGIEVSALILSEGLTSRESETIKFTKEDLEEVKNDSYDAAKIVGIHNVYFEDLPNNRLDSLDLLDLIKIIESHVRKLQPTMVFTHHYGDVNIAHRITYQAVLTACRPLETCPVKRLYCFEIPSSTEWAFPAHKDSFSPNVFLEVGEEAIDNKIKAMQAYRTERRKMPHPRSPESIKAIALRWGCMSNQSYSEAYELVYEKGRL